MDYRKLAASLAASLAACGAATQSNAAPQAPQATSAPQPTGDAARLADRYAQFLGGRANADAVIAGLRSGSAITLVTNGADRNLSLAGFTPPGPMSEQQINNALAAAQRSLSRLGIHKPNAEQIQAALIGGEVTQPNGNIALVQGQFAASGMQPASGRVARR
jgi:hypothetical protein